MRHLGKQENLIVDSGATFPEPDNGELFIIDDDSNEITDGLYWYSSKLTQWILLVPITVLDDAVSTAVSNAPAKIVAQSENGDVNGSKIKFSSTIKLKEVEEGVISLEYTPPLIELTRATPIDINAANEVAIPFNSVVSEDSSIFEFEDGDSKVKVLVSGVYDVTYRVNAQYDEHRGNRPGSGSKKNSNTRTYIKVNGQNVNRRSSSYSFVEDNKAENSTNSGGCVIELQTGDYVELCCTRAGNRAVTRLIEEETLITVKLLKEL